MPVKNTTHRNTKKYLKILKNGNRKIKMTSRTNISTRIASTASLANLIPSPKKILVAKMKCPRVEPERKHAKNLIMIKDMKPHANGPDHREGEGGEITRAQSKKVEIPVFVRPKRKKFTASTPMDDIYEMHKGGSDLSIEEKLVTDLDISNKSADLSIELKDLNGEREGLNRPRRSKGVLKPKGKTNNPHKLNGGIGRNSKKRKPKRKKSKPPHEDDDVFSLEKAIAKLEKLTKSGITEEEFEEIFIPKHRKATFTEHYYFRIFEKYLEEC